MQGRARVYLRYLTRHPLAQRRNLRHIGAAHVNPQGLADVDSLIDVLIQQQLDQFALEGHGLLRTGGPDELAGGDDAIVGDVHAERVFAEAHDVLAGLAVEADKAVELVGGLADELRSDVHDKPHEMSQWTADQGFTRKASNRVSLCRGNCRGKEYCKVAHKSAEKTVCSGVYVGAAIAQRSLSC